MAFLTFKGPTNTIMPVGTRTVPRPGATSLVVRAVTPTTRTAIIVAPVRRFIGSPRRSVVEHMKGYSTVSPRSKVAGDPIRLLDRNRNASPRNVLAGDMRLKHPDYSQIMRRVGLLERATPQRQAQARLFADKQVERARVGQSPVVRLGIKGNGLAYYSRPRLKPNLIQGFLGWVAPTRRDDVRGVTSLQTTMPVSVPSRLAAEGSRSDALGPNKVLPLGQSYRVPEFSPQPLSGGTSFTNLLVFGGALVLAFWVLKGRA